MTVKIKLSDGSVDIFDDDSSGVFSYHHQGNTIRVFKNMNSGASKLSVTYNYRYVASVAGLGRPPRDARYDNNGSSDEDED